MIACKSVDAEASTVIVTLAEVNAPLLLSVTINTTSYNSPVDS
jgi:hypothetical protein